MKKLRIFCDFDGTIAVHDVGNLVFTHFGDANYWWHLVEQWKKGEIDGRALWTQQCAVTRIIADDLDAFASRQAIDAHFQDFVRYCRKQNYPVYVLSDGMDAYIERILGQYQLGDLQIRANHLNLAADGVLHVSFPYYGQSCGRCANCKGSHLRQERQTGETTVYIGDGYSDICALGNADMVFAKKDLALYCRSRGYPYHAYDDFADVQEMLRAIVRSKSPGDQPSTA